MDTDGLSERTVFIGIWSLGLLWSLVFGIWCIPTALTPTLPMNLPATNPPLTPPSRGTGRPVLLPSSEGLGVGSGAHCAQNFPGRLSPKRGRKTALRVRVSVSIRVHPWFNDSCLFVFICG